jgi:hypothetical protein
MQCAAVMMSEKNTFLHLSSDEECNGPMRRAISMPVPKIEFMSQVEQDLSLMIEIPSPSACAESIVSPLSDRTESTRATPLSEMGERRHKARFPAKPKNESRFTTVMLRNIPCKYSQDQLLEELSEFGNVNFLYLPLVRTMNKAKNLGYAFVNFVSAEEAKAFIANFANHTFKHFPNSTKKAQVDYAELQGFKQNVKFFSRAKLRNSCKPFIAKA